MSERIAGDVTDDREEASSDVDAYFRGVVFGIARNFRSPSLGQIMEKGERSDLSLA